VYIGIIGLIQRQVVDLTMLGAKKTRIGLKFGLLTYGDNQLMRKVTSLNVVRAFNAKICAKA